MDEYESKKHRGFGIIEILLYLSLLFLAYFIGIYVRNCRNSEEYILNTQNLKNSYNIVNSSNEIGNPNINSYNIYTNKDKSKDFENVDLIDKLKFSCGIELNDKIVEVTLNFKNLSNSDVESFYISNIFLGDSSNRISSSLCNRKVDLKNKDYITFPISVNEYNSLGLKDKNYCSLMFTISNEDMSDTVNLDRIVLPM